MRVSKEQTALHRAALISAASRLLQENGFDGTGVAEISAKAGLTQGALYAQFDSKGALAAAACRQSHEQGLQIWINRQGETSSDAIAYLDQYLQAEHVDDPGSGCPMAAFASEIHRQGADVQDAFTDGFLAMVKLMQGALADSESAAARKRALLLISAMAGSVAMARATAAVDPALSKEIIAAAREGLELFAKKGTQPKKKTAKIKK